ncbi:uncharacterized protein LOC142330645 [Lycorma delicatula]|uniref:uncharacterized protein LOC142330645 n=1 Tax=Lycorma delicatula TaxID=130591 RepID=UPI003F51A8B8
MTAENMEVVQVTITRSTLRSAKLTLIEKIKSALEEEHKEFVNNTLTVLSAHVNSAIKKNEQFAETLQLVERLEKQLQEHCGRMKTEVENIKQELENSKELKAKNIAYKSKIMKLTSKIIKLIEHNKKIADCYEQKINVLKKSKDMELWVQKLSFGSSLTNGKKQELENIVSTLEEKFRKQLTNATQITLHNIDPTIKRLQKSKYSGLYFFTVVKPSAASFD